MIFSVYLSLFEEIIGKAKKDNTYDQGILEITGALSSGFEKPTCIHVDKDGNEAFHYSVSVDRGITWSESLDIREEAICDEVNRKAPTSYSSRSKSKKQNGLFGYFKTHNSTISGAHLVVLAIDRY